MSDFLGGVVVGIFSVLLWVLIVGFAVPDKPITRALIELEFLKTHCVPVLVPEKGDD